MYISLKTTWYNSGSYQVGLIAAKKYGNILAIETDINPGLIILEDFQADAREDPVQSFIYYACSKNYFPV
jgi:hypothetical protein